MTNNATKVEVTYSGKMDGLTFEKFDDLVVRWGRKKWGDKYATALWQGGQAIAKEGRGSNAHYATILF